MTRSEMIMMANDAGFPSLTEYGNEFLKRFFGMVAASVKEEDAKLCESRHENGNYKHDTRHDCADAIRASINQEVTE